MLPLYKTILVTSDFSPNSDHAFKHAVMLARQNNAKIYLLHVIQHVDSSIRGYLATVIGESRLTEFEQKNYHNAQEELRKELNQFAEKELRNYPQDLARFAGSSVAIGQAVPQILATAEELNADVIVMGTHGKGVIEHAFLGSIAEKVLRKANRPVLTIPLPN